MLNMVIVFPSYDGFMVSFEYSCGFNNFHTIGNHRLLKFINQNGDIDIKTWPEPPALVIESAPQQNSACCRIHRIINKGDHAFLIDGLILR